MKAYQNQVASLLIALLASANAVTAVADAPSPPAAVAPVSDTPSAAEDVETQSIALAIAKLKSEIPGHAAALATTKTRLDKLSPDHDRIEADPQLQKSVRDWESAMAEKDDARGADRATYLKQDRAELVAQAAMRKANEAAYADLKTAYVSYHQSLVDLLSKQRQLQYQMREFHAAVAKKRTDEQRDKLAKSDADARSAIDREFEASIKKVETAKLAALNMQATQITIQQQRLEAAARTKEIELRQLEESVKDLPPEDAATKLAAAAKDIEARWEATRKDVTEKRATASKALDSVLTEAVQQSMAAVQMLEQKRKTADDALKAAEAELVKAMASAPKLEETFEQGEQQRETQFAAADELRKKVLGAMDERFVRARRRNHPSQTVSDAVGSRILLEVKLHEIGFSDTIEFMRDVSGANIYVDWHSLAQAGVERNAAVSTRLENITFDDAMKLVAKSVRAADGSTPVRVETALPFALVSTEAGIKAWRERLASHEKLLASDRKAAAVLSQPLPEAKLDNVSLDEALAFAGDVMGVAVAVDWAAIEKSSPHARKQPVSLRVYNLETGIVLCLILDAANIGPSVKLTCPVGNPRIGLFPKPTAEE